MLGWYWINKQFFFSDLETEYKHLETKSKQIPKISLFLRLLRKPKEDKSRNLMKKFKDELKDLKNILNRIKKLKVLRQ